MSTPSSCCETPKKKKPEYLLYSVLFFVIFGYLFSFFNTGNLYFDIYSENVFRLVNTMWWGLLIGVIFVGLLDGIPRNIIMQMMGKGGTFRGVLQSAFVGILLDLCSHGILVVGAKFYKKGISLGQLMAFLIASPWNSFSLTLILWSLIGFRWMFLFLILSLCIAIISGWIFDTLVSKNLLPDNPYVEEQKSVSVSEYLKTRQYSFDSFFSLLKIGIRDSKMILKWILFGIVLASLIRAFVPMDMFQATFAPTAIGLFLTVIFATILEVCSEGSVPVAADIFTVAKAPGNAFAFLMTGVSTDYTEMLTIKEATGSWKIAFFLPLVTLPQIIFLGYIINTFM